MRKSGTSDPELLAEWLHHQRESAFRELVARYAGLVHATALRTCSDASLAAEASQLTFILLARKAASLASCPSLGGWLHRSALLQAKNLLRGKRREQRKLEQLAMETHPPSQGESWREIQPALDESLAALSAKDREALLLRFYRALSVREVAETLCIATDAAQKRIDRATERLRAKLLRRGCQAGGSLAATMLAGFTADAQAAVPAVSLLASKAIAAGAAGTGVFSTATTFLSATVMKTTSVAVPIIALCAAGAWVGSQRQSIARLQQESILLREYLATTASISAPAKKVTQVTTALDRKPIDWAEVARQMSDKRFAAKVEEYLAALGEDELNASLDEIAAAELSNVHRDLLQRHLGVLLLEKNPERGLSKFIDRVHEEGPSPFSWTLADHLGKWARSNPKAAEAWFDARISAGDFDGRNLRGSDYTRIRFERNITYGLLSSDPVAAGRRLSAFPEDKRIGILQGERRSISEDEQLPLAKLLREHLPDKDRLNVITWPVSELGEGGTIEYPELKAYLERIGARTDERDACILAVAAKTFPRKSGHFFETANEDLVALRSWVGSEAPELTSRATGAAIKGLLQTFHYPEAAGIALHLHKTGSGDEVLLPLLEHHKAPANKELARSIAAKLSDGKLRTKFLEALK